MPSHTRWIERWCRHSGASLLAFVGIIGAPFLMFSIAYATTLYARFGRWDPWDAPTEIGRASRVAAIVLVAIAAFGAALLLASWLLRRTQRARSAPSTRAVA